MKMTARAGALPLHLLFLAAGCGNAPAQADGREAATGLRGIELVGAEPAPDFALQDTDGRSFRFREETAGYVTLLFFGYTSCPDVCPIHLANLAAVLERLPWRDRERVRVVFVTTDPERDTPDRIRGWLDNFDRRFIGLRGTVEAVNGIQAALGLPPAVLDDATAPGGDYAVGHSSQVIALAADGRPRVTYPFGTRQEDWAHDLPRLIREDVMTIERAVVAHAGGAVPAVAYLTIAHRGRRDDALTGIVSDAAARVELHDGASMRPLRELRVPAGGSARLRPGAEHAMLIGVRRSLAPDDTIRLRLEFRDAGARTVLARVVAYDQVLEATD